MLQNVQGHDVYVVVIPDGFLNLPVTSGGDPKLQPYADALNAAYMRGLVRKPGKYAIEFDEAMINWTFYAINE